MNTVIMDVQIRKEAPPSKFKGLTQNSQKGKQTVFYILTHFDQIKD